jgi:hypothetical protein
MEPTISGHEAVHHDDLLVHNWRPLEEGMCSGPSTFRRNVSTHEMMHFTEEHNLRTALVTTSQGRLVGPSKREDGEKS